MNDLAEAVKLVSDLGPTAVVALVFLWFAKWLPRHLDKQITTFQSEMKTERERCDRLYADLRETFDDQRAEILRAIREDRR